MFKRTSKNYLKYQEEKAAREEYKEFLVEHKGVKHLDALLLDSSLISATNKKTYYFKVVDCGLYKQIYYYNKPKNKKDENLEKYKKYEIDTTFLFKEENIKRKEEKKYIETKNINRSKFKLQRLIKSNEKEFKTFITLTFSDEDYKDIETSNIRFHDFTTMIRRIYKDFKYVCVPEFQKNGKVHYHMLTNIDYDNSKLINENIYYTKLLNKIKNKKIKLYKNKIIKDNLDHKINDFNICLRKIENKLQNTKKTYNYKSKKIKIFKTIKYWNKGYSNILNMKDFNVIGYLTKYMTKDIDNRLFSRQRYLFSRNLIIPREYYIDCNNENELKYYLNIINNSKIEYEHTYLDKLENEIKFIEYKLNNNVLDDLFDDFITYV